MDKKTTDPRQALTLLASIVATVILMGCGITDMYDVYTRINATTDKNRLMPSWPVGYTLELADASLAFSDDIIQKGLKTGALKDLLTFDASGAGAITPPANNIPSVKLGDKLKVETGSTTPIPAKTIGIPVTGQTVAATSIKLSETPAGQASFNFGPPIGAVTLAVAKSVPGADLLPLPAPGASLNKVQNSTQPLADVQDATIGTGSITIPLSNKTAGTLTFEITLKDNGGSGQTLGSTTSILPPKDSTSGAPSTVTIVFNLAGKTITSPLVTQATTSGTIPAGTLLAQIDVANDEMKIGPTVIAMQATQAHVRVKGRQGSNPGLTETFDPNLADIIQAFDISNKIPADSGIKRLDSVEVASGSLLVDLTNGFGLDGDMSLKFVGITQIRSAPSGTILIKVDAGKQSTTSIDLAGALITPDANGKISAIVSPATLDTDADRTHGTAIAPNHNFALVKDNDKLFGSVTMSPLTFIRVKGSFDRDVPIASSDIPISLPKEITSTGLAPAQITIKLILDNQSQIAGTLTPTISGIKPDGTLIPVTLNGPGVLPPQEVFKGTFLGATVEGATKSNIVEINERNSNILDILDQGASKIRFGGNARAIGDGISIAAGDQIAGKVEVSLPLAFKILPFGLGSSRPPYDINPPSPLGFDAGTKDKLRKHLRIAAIDFKIDNGWKLPLNLTLLLSSQADPYNDPRAISKTIFLGSGGTTPSTLDLNEDDIKVLPDLKFMGFRITSAGSNGQIVKILTTDKIRIRLAARLKVVVSGELLGGK